MLTPPLVTIASTRLAASRNVCSSNSSSSLIMPRSTAVAPASCTMRTSIVRLLSRICPIFRTDPSSTSSSPVDKTPTTARRYTCTVRALTLDNTPTATALITVPATNTRSPAVTSDPAARIAAPLGTDAEMRTCDAPTRSVSSTITIASAPVGIGAPVMMRIASPAPTVIVGAAPAASSPITRNSHGTC